MEKIIIEGGNKIGGQMEMYSAKNSVLPILSASLMVDGTTTLHRCPKIMDVVNMLKIMDSIGCKTRFENGTITVHSSDASNHVVDEELAKTLRSSVFLLGSVLGRFKKAVIAYPGGCDIGLRPINLHIKGLKAMNVDIKEENGCIVCDGSNMRGATVHLDMPSVGATENIMMCATLTKGTTIIKNSAREPEIVDLQNYLVSCGAKIYGAGKSTIVIEGVEKLHGTTYNPISDRVVTGTYLIASAVTGGEIEISNINFEHICPIVAKLQESTCKIQCINDRIYMQAPKSLKAIKKIVTMPHPGFPTDMQAQITAMLAVSQGVSIVQENMFEMRFRHISELVKMGADITVSGNVAVISGVKKLQGANVSAYDLRGGAGMCIAGLVAEGTTVISHPLHIDRGYESIENELRSLGANIRRIGEP